MMDLFLHYRFTDEDGTRVYDAYPAEDRATRKEYLGEVRLADGERPILRGLSGPSKVHGAGTG